MKGPALDTIAEAFSRTASRYDAFATDHPHLTRMREKVYAHIQRLVPPESRILELNAGTGTDAVQLARRGYYVHATDIAAGMLARLPDKLRGAGLEGRVTAEERSFFELEGISGAPFDGVFSNLGGLNCTADLGSVIRQLPKILRPGGVVCWVLMPHVCLWELGEILRGHPRLALRRLARGSVSANLEGLKFDVYYFAPRQVIKWFGKEYELLALEGLSVFTPTAESRSFAKRYPRLYRGLSWLDDCLSPHWPWYGAGDFFIVSLRSRT